MSLVALAGSLLAGCVDYHATAVSENQPVSVNVPGESPEGFAVIAASEPPAVIPTEACNGIDDDGDGEVDEGFEDIDRDGVPDCLDEDCSPDLDKARGLSDARTCDESTTTFTGTLGLDPLWSLTGGAFDDDYSVGCHVVLVADLDVDGNAELLCSGDQIHVFDGLTGQWLYDLQGVMAWSPLLVVDADRDGWPEVWAVDDEAHAVAFGPSHTVERRSAEPISDLYGTTGDLIYFSWAATPWGSTGEPALVGPDAVVSLLDGRTLATFEKTGRFGTIYENVIALDAEGDGEVEIYRAGVRFDTAGQIVAELHASSSDGGASWVRPIQADTDEHAELLWVSDDEWAITEADGTVLRERAVTSAGWGHAKACVAMDRTRNEQFFGFQSGTGFRTTDLLGNTLWQFELSNQLGAAACTAFDFDADGIDDLWAKDDGDPGIYAGADGTNLTAAEACSEPNNEVSIVVDMDRDGQLEVVSSAGSVDCYAESGERVLQRGEILAVHRVSGVGADAPNHWPIPDWSGTELNPDLTMPRTQRPNWLTTCAVPSQNQQAQEGSDVSPVVIDSCTPDCDDGLVSVALSLENRGPLEMNTSTPVAVYDAGGTLLTVVTFADWVDDWTQSAGVSFNVPMDQATTGLVIVAGDDGSGNVVIDDPNHANNRLEWRFNRCD